MEESSHTPPHNSFDAPTHRQPSARHSSHKQNRHRHHHSHEDSRKRRKKRERQQRFKKICSIVMVVLLVSALLVIVMALLAPGLLMHFSSTERPLGNGVVHTPTGNRHLQLDYDGIDVSHHQGRIDWKRVALDTCVQFVYIKATEGKTIIDSNYLHNVEQALAAGLNVGSYHYLTSKSSIVHQFRNFYSVVDRRKQKIVPMIDVEQEGLAGWNCQQIQDSLARLVRLIENHYHCSPIIYSYTKFYNQNLAPRFNSYTLFLARYHVNEPVVAGAGRNFIWQHSDQGIVDGISTPVDLNIFGQGTTLKDILMPSTH